jgi:RNA polymerase sigma-70 factor (ECF subfamily)
LHASAQLGIINAGLVESNSVAAVRFGPKALGGSTSRNGGLALSQADFQRWVVEHGPPMYRIAYRMVGDRHEAEDVVQDAFRSAWKSRRSFEAGRGERAWLVAILRRRVVDYWRRGPALNVVSSENSLDIGVSADDPLANDYSDEMQSALACLPPELKETLLLVVVAELTHQEAADLLKVPLGTVLSRVSRARARLREALLGRSAAKPDARVSKMTEPTGPEDVAESPRR